VQFFPDPPPPPPVEDWDQHAQPGWLGPPEDVLAGVVPLELVIGRSDDTVVFLHGVRAFPTGLSMTLGVRVRGRVRRKDLHGEVCDGPYLHEMDADWQARRLKWGFEFADGRRVTNVDPLPVDDRAQDRDTPYPVASWELGQDGPMLTGGGGGGGPRSVERSYWLWRLPPAGPLRVACEWLDQGIELTVTELGAEPFLAAAARAQPLWY
jgi:hypothetical protein